MNTSNPSTPYPVTENALYRRLRRKFAREGKRFCKTRLSQYSNMGRFHLVKDNYLVMTWNDSIEDLAREFGAMHLRETVAAS